MFCERVEAAAAGWASSWRVFGDGERMLLLFVDVAARMRVMV